MWQPLPQHGLERSGARVGVRLLALGTWATRCPPCAGRGASWAGQNSWLTRCPGLRATGEASCAGHPPSLPILSSGYSNLGYGQPCSSLVFHFPCGKHGLIFSLVNPGVRDEVGPCVSNLGPGLARTLAGETPQTPDTSHLVSDPAYPLWSSQWVGREERSLGLLDTIQTPFPQASPI